jgi:GT2 family glycosyltransferase
VRLLEHGKNLGVSRANNTAATIVDSEYIAFLNNDTRVATDWLSRMVEALDPARGVIAVGAKMLSWDGRKIDFVGPKVSFHGSADQVDYGSPNVDKHNVTRPILAPCGGAMVIEREIFLEVGGFDEDYFAFFEDTDLGWRLWVLGYRVVLAPEAVVYHHHHGSWGHRDLAPTKRVMYERNALFTIVKNYEEATLQRILPVALLLTAKRALLTSQLDLTPYRPPGSHPLRRASAQPRRPIGAEPEMGFTARLRQSWRRNGLVGTANKALEKLSTTILLTASQALPWTDTELLPKEAVSHVVALDEVADAMDKMLIKRARIQAARCRSDSEIVPLFQDPFWPVAKDLEYLKTVERLANAFGLNEIFGSI